MALTPGTGRAEGGAAGGGAEPGKPGPRGPQLSPWREGTQPLPLLRQGQDRSPTTQARPRLTSWPGEVPGEQGLHSPGLHV